MLLSSSSLSTCLVLCVLFGFHFSIIFYGHLCWFLSRLVKVLFCFYWVFNQCQVFSADLFSSTCWFWLHWLLLVYSDCLLGWHMHCFVCYWFQLMKGFLFFPCVWVVISVLCYVVHWCSFAILTSLCGFWIYYFYYRVYTQLSTMDQASIIWFSNSVFIPLYWVVVFNFSHFLFDVQIYPYCIMMINAFKKLEILWELVQ